MCRAAAGYAHLYAVAGLEAAFPVTVGCRTLERPCGRPRAPERDCAVVTAEKRIVDIAARSHQYDASRKNGKNFSEVCHHHFYVIFVKNRQSADSRNNQNNPHSYNTYAQTGIFVLLYEQVYILLKRPQYFRGAKIMFLSHMANTCVEKWGCGGK